MGGCGSYHCQHQPQLALSRALATHTQCMMGPKAPKEIQLYHLKQMEVHIPGQIEAGLCPPWLRDVCRYRDAFEGAVLCFSPDGPGGEVQYVSFLYACQQPFYAMFLALERLQSVQPAVAISSARFQAWAKENWEHIPQD